MASDIICPGCDVLFSQRGYVMHTAQTRNPDCQAIDPSRQQAWRSAQISVSHVEVMSESGDNKDSEWEDEEGGNGDDEMDLDWGGDEPMPDAMDVIEDEPDESDEEVAAIEAELETSWEPMRQGAPTISPSNNNSESDMETVPSLPPPRPKTQMAAGHGLKAEVIERFSDRYPSSNPGGVIYQDDAIDDTYSSAVGSNGSNPWAPFHSKTDWDVACWAKRRGPGSTAFTELLGIDGVQEKLGLSYRSSDDLNKIIDHKLPSRPPFERHEVVQNGESLEFYSRDIIRCLEAIWRDPDFVDDLIVQPEKHYADSAKKICVYHDMHTGKWWWSTQKKVQRRTKNNSCTIVPVIISSDKTQLTDFRGQQAYPVYMTIGNLPKHIRRKPTRQSQILIAYLPTSKLLHITNKASRRRCLSNLFHHCMRHITKALVSADRTGVIFVSGDGKARRCYPILAAYVGDYPEQLLVTLVKSGECPVCPTSRNEIGDLSKTKPPRSTKKVIHALNQIHKGSRHFKVACKRQGIKPVQSVFWKSLPDVDIYRSITPDLLHQLYQGVFKHLVAWVRQAVGDEEIDARCRRLPPNHHIRLFMKGISHLSRVTGTEHDQISRFLLGLVADIQLPNQASSTRLVRCVRSLLDFMQIARYPIHSEETLREMKDALEEYHHTKDIFVELGIRDGFNIPKIHMMSHYCDFIEYFGSPDNFNTEYTERLHIEQAKDAYAATNHKNELPQMTRWLDRRERIMQHEKFIRRRLDCIANSPLHVDKPPPSLIPKRTLRMSKHPSTPGVPLSQLEQRYGALNIRTAIPRYIIKYLNPDISNADLEHKVEQFHLPFQKIPIFHRITFVSKDPYTLNPLNDNVVDSVHIDPAHVDRDGRVIPGRFDTVLVRLKNTPNNESSQGCAQDYRVAQVRCVFALPQRAVDRWFPVGFPHHHFAYVEWFSPLSPGSIDPNTGLYKIHRLQDNGTRRAGVIPVGLIVGSVHLLPKFGAQAPTSWSSSNVLDRASHFYVNEFAERYIYSVM